MVRNKSSFRALLSYFLEKLSKRKKYLAIYFSKVYFQKLISLFFKNHMNMLIAILLLVDITFPMTRLIIKPSRATI